jgi:hypothetical protein
MGDKRQRTRVTSKIDQLPNDIKIQIDEMILDASITYQEISEWLKSQGHNISRSAVGRYALRANKASQRIVEAQNQINSLIRAIQANPTEDYTGAGLQIMIRRLAEKMATADEEFEELSLDKAGRLLVSAARTESYKDKVKYDMKKKAELAFEELEGKLLEMIKHDKELGPKLSTILQEAKNKVIEDD